MTHLRPILTLRRTPLLWALTHLPSINVVVLLYLAAHACPTTARVWTTPRRIAEELGYAPASVEEILTRLVRADLITLSVVRGDLRAIELGPLFARDGSAPENIPIEQSV